MTRRRGRSPEPFTGPKATLFIYERGSSSWLISAWDGSEARVPAEDLRQFVRLHFPRPEREGSGEK